MVIAEFQATKPDDLDFTLTLTMPLRDWEDFVETLTTQYPAWKVASAIKEMIWAAKKTYTEKIKVED